VEITTPNAINVEAQVIVESKEKVPEHDQQKRMTEDQAAVKVQAVFRGFKARVSFKQQKGALLLSNMVKEVTSTTEVIPTVTEVTKENKEEQPIAEVHKEVADENKEHKTTEASKEEHITTDVNKEVNKEEHLTAQENKEEVQKVDVIKEGLDTPPVIQEITSIATQLSNTEEKKNITHY